MAQQPDILNFSTIEDFFQLLQDRQAVFTKLIQINVLRPGICCGLVRNLQACNQYSDGYCFRCGTCRRRRSIRAESKLENCHLEITTVLKIAVFWANEATVKLTCAMLGIGKATVIRWFKKFRSACSAILHANQQLLQFGGPGQVVQIDETLVAKAKYNRGHALHQPQQWVFGIYDPARKRGYAELVNDRSAATLTPIILRHVSAGSEIWSDQWNAYVNLGNLPGNPYNHSTVDHSRHFKDPVTGVHTNHVENYWSRLKKLTRVAGNRSAIPGRIDEFMWRERFGGSGLPAYANFLRRVGLLP